MRYLSVFAIFLAFSSASLLADSSNKGLPWPTANWDRSLASIAAEQENTDPESERLYGLASQRAGPKLLPALRTLASRPDWPAPAREAVLLRFTQQLRQLPPFSVDGAVLDFLANYQSQTLVEHEEIPGLGVALYPIRAAAAGVNHHWTRQQAAFEATVLMARDLQGLLESYADSQNVNIRAGIEDAVTAADRSDVQALIDIALPQLPGKPQLTGLLGKSAVAIGNRQAVAEVLIQGAGYSLLEVTRQASQQFSKEELGELLLATIESAPASTAAITIGVLAPFSIAQLDVSTALMESLNHPDLGSTAALALVQWGSDEQRHALEAKAAEDPSSLVTIQAQGAIEEWTEQDGVLGLGYPVPIPVDTPLPFDGFRSYNGLHTRHQDLVNSTDIVHGVIVGTTHNKRDIWAYQIGDDDPLTWEGFPEPAMMTNGGIHPREWQSPEVVTGIMELFTEMRGDRHFYDYLLENTNIVLLPVQNVDSFLQTQRFPTQNWLRTDPLDIPNDPAPAPRDGRMRRKNMPAVDEILTTRDDHLLGVDLNRNNPPFWNTDPNRSSPDNTSLVHHGPAPHSEPEAQALAAAVALGPLEQLRAFTDIHSFSQVFYWNRTTNQRLSNNLIGLLNTMANHNAALPNGALYLFNADPTAAVGVGFGMTNEWISTSLRIPSWGVEVEPTQPSNSGVFPGNPPGCGANYGGFANNCHDGFILPESEIKRVRENLARSFAAVYYQQSGPPSIAAVRFVDVATQAVVFEAEWDPVSENQRVLYVKQIQPLVLDQNYTFWIAYDRPMRWRSGGQVAPFPGQPGSTLDFSGRAFINNTQLSAILNNERWLNSAGDAPNGYYRYQDDAFATEVVLPSDSTNLNQVTGANLAIIHNSTKNMTGQSLDADPSTPVTWAAGGWSGYEDFKGQAGDVGGTDANIQVLISRNSQPAPFLVEPGTSAAWFDPKNNGEGFIIEILANNVVVMYWFTYDKTGEQAWYIAVGEVRGNRLIFPEVIQTSGGVFGPDFDPDLVVRTVVGSASFLYEDCGAGTMVYHLKGRKGRFNLQRLSRVMGANCGGFLGPPIRPEVIESGSWFNVNQSGHGFVIEVLAGSEVLVYWFSYDKEGNQAWFFGTGSIEGGELVIAETFQTRGPVFGPDFNPADVVLIPWGEMRFDLSCLTGSVAYDGTAAGFGTANLDLNRLTHLADLSCEESL